MAPPRLHNVHIMGNVNEMWVEHTLFMAVEYAHGVDVEGDVIEFGTMTGSTAAALALGIKAIGGAKKLYLLDSFEGLPKPVLPQDTESVHVQKGIWHEGLCIALDETQLRAKMSEILLDSQFEIIKGWYSDTAPTLAGPFSVIHVDCDFFASTMDALDPLFRQALISPGAMILFDDWNCNRADPRNGERAAWAALVDHYDIEFSDEGSYGIAGHKFIVHSYVSAQGEVR